MAKLVARLARKSPYALSIDRRNPTPDIHCVSKQDIDARRVAEALGAQVAGGYPEWAGQRTFHQDSKSRKVIAAALDGVEQ